MALKKKSRRKQRLASICPSCGATDRNAIAACNNPWHNPPQGESLTKVLAAAVEFETHGGATSSKLTDVRYDLVPQTFVTRTAQRYAEGIRKGHKEYNFRAGDESFVRSRINHLFKHLYLVLSGVDSGFDSREDDNLGACAWAISFLMELQTTSEGRSKFCDALLTMNPQLKDKDGRFRRENS